MSSTLPTIFLIHGATMQPDHYSALIKILEVRGHMVKAYLNPTCVAKPRDQLTTESPENKLTIYDGVGFLKPRLDELIAEEKEVFVIAHSYGGSVMSEMVTGDLTLSSRMARGKKGGVLGLFFCCAFLLDVGQDLNTYQPTIREQDGPFLEFDPSTGLMNAGRFDLYCYNDMPAAESDVARALALPWSIATASVPIRNAGQRFTPSTYLICTEDNAMREDVQRQMIAQMKSVGVVIREVVCGSSHSPMYSMPKALADEIQAAIEWSRKESDQNRC